MTASEICSSSRLLWTPENHVSISFAALCWCMQNGAWEANRLRVKVTSLAAENDALRLHVRDLLKEMSSHQSSSEVRHRLQHLTIAKVVSSHAVWLCCLESIPELPLWPMNVASSIVDDFADCHSSKDSHLGAAPMKTKCCACSYNQPGQMYW